MGKKILFRADAKPSIGIGDLMSFINLSCYFKKYGWECSFCIRDYDAGLSLVKNNNIQNVHIIDHGVTIEEEQDQLNCIIQTNNINVFFVQTNEYSLFDYKNVGEGVYKACVCFDYNLPENYDVALSWDVDSSKYFQKTNSKTKYFIGSEYVILPINFDINIIKKRILKKTVKNLLICMGGADENNITLNIIKRLYEINAQYTLHIVLGAGYSHKKELQTFFKTNAFCEYVIHENVTNMFELYMNADFAIGAGGLVASELVCTRTPSLLIPVYEHQITRCIYFEKMGWVKNLGFMQIDNIKKEYINTDNAKDHTFFIPKINELVQYINELNWI